ncbi:Cyclic nucleotide-gated cation channel beta-1 [Hypsibius exemplaris]|uniref:Cyclic nucleotide-gated cation channel beta-1 n=1 Tax=Hypsibius exemplaris TaxID=2072580 RepID=A0A1W0XFR6_HYPEX|nr:Cyclic nucleotide-gated cation channel beta-1 [Hypsibius exemplaris]
MDSELENQFQRPKFPPVLHVSSDTEEGSLNGEPSHVPGPKGGGTLRARRKGMEHSLLAVSVEPVVVYDVAEALASPKLSVLSDGETSGVSDQLLGNLNGGQDAPVVDYVDNIDSLGAGGTTARKCSTDTARLRGIKFIDETPRGISDTARSSYIPPHLLNQTGRPIPTIVRVGSLDVNTIQPVMDQLGGGAGGSRLSDRRYSSAYSTDGGSARSLERGQQIQEQLHKLVSAFHERARQVKEQVVIQPPSPTISPVEENKPLPRLSIPLHQMPIRPATPSRTEAASRLAHEVTILGRTFTLPAWCPRPRMPRAMEPQSPLFISWLFIVSMAFMYNAYAIPFRAAFSDYTRPDWSMTYWFIVDYFCDLLYLIDIIVFKTSVKFVSNGVWVENRQDIVRRYTHSWRFRLDVIASIPLDFFYLALNKGELKDGWKGAGVLLRLPKLLKLPSYWESHNRLDQVARSPHLLRVLNSLAYMMWMIHANACIFYSISMWERSQNIKNRWIYSEFIDGRIYPVPAYLHCFWRSFIVATAVGNAPEPENIVENAYMIFSWLVGVFVFALLIGQIRDIFTQMSYQEDHYKKTVDTTVRYLQNLRIPKTIQTRVREWYTYNWEQHKTLDENSLLDGLPKKLKTDLVLSVHYQTLAKVQLFQGTEQSLLRDLVLKLRPVVFLPNEYICKRGEVGKEMYIVRSGYLDVVTSDGRIVATMSEGGVFGEISLLSLVGGNRRTADVRSKGYSNLYVLNKYDLHEVLRDYPEAQEMLKKKAYRLYGPVTPADEKKEVPIEVIKTRTPTPEFFRTVINVMDPRSSLRQRLASSLSKPPDFPKVVNPDQSSEEDIHLPGPLDGESREDMNTPRPTHPEGLTVEEQPGNKRPTSTELVRRRRELQLQRHSSSEIEIPEEIKRPPRRLLRSPFRSKSPAAPPAPIAKIEADDVSLDSKDGHGSSSRMSFLPGFIRSPLKKLFNRPKIIPVVVNDLQSTTEGNELFEMPPQQPLPRTPRRRRSVHEQVFDMPSFHPSEAVGSRPPSVRSTSESGYDHLNLDPPDLERSSSTDFSDKTLANLRGVTLKRDDL